MKPRFELTDVSTGSTADDEAFFANALAHPPIPADATLEQARDVFDSFAALNPPIPAEVSITHVDANGASAQWLPRGVRAAGVNGHPHAFRVASTRAERAARVGGGPRAGRVAASFVSQRAICGAAQPALSLPTCSRVRDAGRQRSDVRSPHTCDRSTNRRDAAMSGVRRWRRSARYPRGRAVADRSPHGP